MRFVALAVGPTVVLALTASQTVPTTASQAPGGDTAAAHRAVLNRYCVSCHNERNKANAGRLALDSVDLSRVGEHAEVLEKVILKLRAGLMPPPGRSRPEPAAHAALPYDMPAIRRIVREARPGGLTLSALVAGIVQSVPFQMRRTAGVSP